MTGVRLLLLACLPLFGAGCGNRLQPDAPAPADAYALLAETSDPYVRNGQRIEGGRFDDAALARLQQSRDPYVRRGAETARALIALNRPTTPPEAPRAALQRTTARYRQLLAQRAASAAAAPDSGSDLRAIGAALEAFAGAESQHALVREQVVKLMDRELRATLRSDMREWQSARRPGRPDAGNTLRVLLDTQRRGLVMVKNQGAATLHNCVLVTRLRADLDRVRVEAAREDLAGQWAGAFYSKEFVDASRLSAKLRHLNNEQDKCRIVYVRELRPGETISAWFDGIVSFYMSRAADISFWSDELSVEHRAPANWDKVKREVEDRAAGRIPRAGSAPPRQPAGVYRSIRSHSDEASRPQRDPPRGLHDPHLRRVGAGGGSTFRFRRGRRQSGDAPPPFQRGRNTDEHGRRFELPITGRTERPVVRR